jgi:hypothetical protein
MTRSAPNEEISRFSLEISSLEESSWEPLSADIKREPTAVA